MAAKALSVLGDFVSLAPLRDKPWGVTWFQAAGGQVGERTFPVRFPRLHLAQTEPDAAFRELVERMIASGDERGLTLLVPPKITTPADLWEPRTADLKDPARIDAPVSLNVPLRVVMAHLDGKRDRGRTSVVNDDPFGWVGATVAYDVLGERAHGAEFLVGSAAAQDLQNSAQSAEAKRAQRHRRETRKRLAEAGVIPWVCWPECDLPHGWLESVDLLHALERWRGQASGIRRSARIVERSLESRRAA